MNTAKKAALVLAATGAAVGSAAGSASAIGGHGHSGATAEAAAVGSPGVISGNIIEIPVDLRPNIVGNSLNVVGILNPVFGNKAANL
ncbi:chaplin [Streptomyces sp. SBT349]|uniref:chaplin n=1 Tax=Streptomyces sp. SBT349 TaxID=1580539 RepID=UPI00066B1ABE|nr:chaplin [Streptomyces sp. SBT349]